MSVNVAVVRGTCSSEPEVRVLASGTTIVIFQLTVRPEVGAAISVPVVAWDPPASVEAYTAGDELVALGRVRRRFYRSGVATASRVEIEAESVVPARDRRRVQALLRRANAALEALAS